VDVNHVPEALLYRAFCHFNLWQYAEAVPLLEHYVTTPLPEYRKTIGQVNLIAAMIGGEQFDRAEKLIEEVLRATAAGGFGRLRANCHELASQIYIQRRDFPRAKESLKAALEILQASNTIDQLFVQKGLAIMSAAESQSIAPLVGFRTEALQRRDWESVRESDLYILKTEFDPSRFSHLIFGSPLPAYRRRVYKELGRMAEGNSYLFGDPNADEMDLMSGEVKGRDNLRAGSKTHQVIEVLLRDLYKPLSIGGLFAELFPEEYFNAFSSPDRVHQILRRSRKWLAENKLPVEIVEFQQSYSIQMTGPFAFRCPLYRGIVNWHEVHMRQLEGSTSARKTLRADQLKGVLGLEGSPFRRFTDWAVKNDRLERVGAGRATAYRIKKAA
jgi:tetratricopeptide (TPR) repeat protein